MTLQKGVQVRGFFLNDVEERRIRRQLRSLGRQLVASPDPVTLLILETGTPTNGKSRHACGYDWAISGAPGQPHHGGNLRLRRAVGDRRQQAPG